MLKTQKQAGNISKDYYKQSMIDETNNLKKIETNIRKTEQEIQSFNKFKRKIIMKEIQYESLLNCYFKQINNSSQDWPLLIERYQILSLIGKGGFAEVYKAFDI